MKSIAEYTTLLVNHVADGVASVKLNRPEFANGVVPELARELFDCLGALEADRDVRVVIMSGAGKSFCAGADLHAMQKYIDESLQAEEEPYNARILHPVTERLANLSLPTIAAINGAATAGGLDLALACDIRIAAKSARLGETYVRLGLAAGNGGAYFLPRLVGPGIAAELAFTGELIDAERALQLRLINEIVEDDVLAARAADLATRIARNPRKALEATKQMLRASWHTDLRASLSTSYWVTSTLQNTRDFKEGVAAAIEKRVPQYNRKRQPDSN